MARSSRQCPQFNLRMPPELKEKLEISAKHNNRSITSELLTILERALNATNTQSPSCNP